MTKEELFRHLTLLFRLQQLEAAIELAFRHGAVFEIIRQEEGAYEERQQRRFPVTFWTQFWEEYGRREQAGEPVTPAIEDGQRVVVRR